MAEEGGGGVNEGSGGRGGGGGGGGVSGKRESQNPMRWFRVDLLTAGTIICDSA